MKQLFLALVSFCLLSTNVMAAGGSSYHLDQAPNDLHNKASLQRGARNFVNYCQGCHSAQYMRYKRIAKDLAIVDEDGNVDQTLMRANLMFNTDNVGNTVLSSIPAADAQTWFGVAPPDLTLIARVRGTDWLYTYLRTFYDDPSKTWGANNAVFPNVGMPNVLVDLQGEREPILDAAGHVTGFTQISDGQLSTAEYDQFVGDLVNFLEYMAEPAKLDRYRIGIWALIFIAIFAVFAFLLKREYWKDVK